MVYVSKCTDTEISSVVTEIVQGLHWVTTFWLSLWLSLLAETKH